MIFIKSSSVEYLYSLIIYSLAGKETKANTNLVQKFKFAICFLLYLDTSMDGSKQNTNTLKDTALLYCITKENKDGPKQDSNFSQ